MAQQALIRQNVPLGGVARDVLVGQTLRFIRSAGPIQIGITAAFGSAVGDVTADVIIGGRSVVQGMVVPIEAAAGSGPLEDRDMKVRDWVKPQDEVLINLANSGAADIVATVYVNLPGQTA